MRAERQIQKELCCLATHNDSSAGCLATMNLFSIGNHSNSCFIDTSTTILLMKDEIDSKIVIFIYIIKF